MSSRNKIPWQIGRDSSDKIKLPCGFCGFSGHPARPRPSRLTPLPRLPQGLPQEGLDPGTVAAQEGTARSDV